MLLWMIIQDLAPTFLEIAVLFDESIWTDQGIHVGSLVHGQSKVHCITEFVVLWGTQIMNLKK